MLAKSPVPPFYKGGTKLPSAKPVLSPVEGGAARSVGGFGSVEVERKLQVRIGIHTGLVVIGEIGSSEKREILALGETPNIAARVQGVAEPDTVVMSAVTHRLVQACLRARTWDPRHSRAFPFLCRCIES